MYNIEYIYIHIYNIFHKPALSLDVSTINLPFLAWLVLDIAEPWTVGAGTAGLYFSRHGFPCVNHWIGLRENLQETMVFYHQI